VLTHFQSLGHSYSPLACVHVCIVAGLSHDSPRSHLSTDDPAPEQQKLFILLHQYVVTWALLIYTTSVVMLGGTYFITAWNAVVLIGAMLACVEGIAGAQGYEDM
jgi:hypothetical protein